MAEIALTEVTFRGHLNLGGLLGKHLFEVGVLTKLYLLENGMVRVERDGKRFHVGATNVEYCVEKEAVAVPLNAEVEVKRTSKRAVAAPPVANRVDSILAEMAGK